MGRGPLNKYLKGMTFDLKEVKEGALSTFTESTFWAEHITVYRCKGPEVGVWQVFKKH